TFKRHVDHLDLHSFPTRRSSDLSTPLPAWALRPCTLALPYAELLLSVLFLLGLRLRFALIAAGLVIVSLDVGLMLQLKHDVVARSEEHTSELQSLAYLVCRLLLE